MAASKVRSVKLTAPWYQMSSNRPGEVIRGGYYRAFSGKVGAEGNAERTTGFPLRSMHEAYESKGRALRAKRGTTEPVSGIVTDHGTDGEPSPTNDDPLGGRLRCRNKASP